MSKPTDFQQRVIVTVANEIGYWSSSNDIHSHSHGTSIEHDMFSNLDEWWEEDEDGSEISGNRALDLSIVAEKVRDLWVAIASLDKCHMREEMNNKIKNNA